MKTGKEPSIEAKEKQEAGRQWSSMPQPEAPFAAQSSLGRKSAALQEENDRLQRVLARMPDGVLTVGRDGICRYSNGSRLLKQPARDPDTDGAERTLDDLLGAELAEAILPKVIISLDKETALHHRFDIKIAGRAATLDAHILPATPDEAVVIVRDMTDRLLMEEGLERRDAILSAVTFAAERFLRGDATNDTINQFLKRLGKATGVGRVYIFKNLKLEDNLPGAELTYEWTRAGTRSLGDSEILEKNGRSEWYSKYWYDRLSAGEVVAGRLTDFPKTGQAILKAFRARSITIAPINVGEKWWGFIGLATNELLRTWSKAEIRSLRTAATVLGAALEQYEAARSLEQSEKRWRQLVDAHPGPIIVSSGGLISYLNRAAADILGASDNEVLIGRAVNDLLPEDILLDCAGESESALENRETESQHSGDYRIIGLDGIERIVEFVSVPAAYEGKPAVQIVLQNVTERKEYERGLIEAKERAEDMNRMKTSFLANMSHEIRTPLTSIIGYAGLLSNEVSGKGQEFAQLIKAGADRLMDTLISVLDFAQLEGGSIRVSDSPVDLRDEINQIWLLYRSRYSEKGVKFVVECMDERLGTVLLDKRAFGRVVINLVDNALKFTDPEGTVVIRAYGNENGNTFTVEVADTGIGIEPSFIPSMFQAFKQESDGLGRRYGGNGLGLAISHKLVTLMGGEIDVRSTVGVGTTFSVTLPLRRPTGEKSPASKSR